MSLFFELAAEGLMAATLTTFGEAATYSPRDGASYSIIVACDTGEAVQNSAGVYMTAWAPLSSFASEPVKGDRITIADRQYLVRDIEKENETGRKLKLSCTSQI